VDRHRATSPRPPQSGQLRGGRVDAILQKTPRFHTQRQAKGRDAAGASWFGEGIGIGHFRLRVPPRASPLTRLTEDPFYDIRPTGRVAPVPALVPTDSMPGLQPA
jgi:hypothetical protein